MVKRKDLSKSNPVNDLESELNADFNDLIEKIHKRLSTKKRSPVYTGFFASSWKVQNVRVQAKERAEDFQPWKGIKREASEYFFKNGRAMPASQVPSQIKRRFPVDRVFNYKKAVFIGNRAKYAVYALEGGKIQSFVQGELGKLIKETMTGKKGKLFIASQKSKAFGSFKGGVGYTEF